MKMMQRAWIGMNSPATKQQQRPSTEVRPSTLANVDITLPTATLALTSSIAGNVEFYQ